MAKVGEGDPRWVVREREDGRNVNNWHWVERDVSSWSQNRLRELLGKIIGKDEEDDIEIKVVEVEKVEGDSILYNRKGLLKVVYDLKAEGKWSVVVDDEDEDGDGKKGTGEGGWKFELFDKEPEVLISVKEDGGVVGLKKIVGRVLGGKVLEVVGVFLEELWKGGDVGLDGVRIVGEGDKKGKVEASVLDYKRTMNGERKGKVVERKKTTESLKLKDAFVCSNEDFFLALTDVKRIEAYTRTRAKSEAVVGGGFELRDGLVVGKYLELDRGKRIVMKWRMKKWPEEAEDSTVTITIEQVEGKAELTLEQSAIPIKWRSETEGFWRAQIFQAIKVCMGYGSANFL
eukprot:Plantae.Rhodophyta-Hildenbrandia_rubra.ctg5252.p1 GENE.Plantae.Rhodophyta-Hildenbrandia_rubra.ctg5252~~Plantae.Rhodophyta-Hildenbrandia_rubra.ctg5252.p1  ORF type:complete len:344 (-),score=111.69 Plantae.Rhodophyta-Hildenbrandia_rubra.ctg5252:619-1650(-)